MSGDVFRLIFLAMAGCLLPVAYLTLCVRMFRRKVWWFTYVAYFCLFGALGGWCFALAVSPSGLAATSFVFLVSIVAAACLISALILQFRKQKNRFERIAMIGAYAYSLPIILLFALAMAIR